jgi:transposase
MAQTVSIIPCGEDHSRLEAVASDRSRPLKHIQRARIVLHSAERLPVLEVARRAGVSRPAVWRWQRRYAEEGIDGLLRDKTRKPGRAPLSQRIVARVLDLRRAAGRRHPLDWPRHGQGRGDFATSRATDLEKHGLQPHRLRSFKRSNDPDFAEKVEDVVGLYMDPPAHAVVVSIDEKSQIQALDRTQPGLPLKPGKCGTTTHDYKRNGTTTLFAALDILHRTVIGHCMKQHRHQEFIRFLSAVERAVPAGKVIHAILDNYATHKHPAVMKWLADHPRWTFHFTPTSASWLNAVEGSFSTITRRKIRRGVFKSVPQLEAEIARYIKEHNRAAKPFVWTKSAKAIFEKLAELPAPSV